MILQSEKGLSEHLDALRPLWQPQTLIHNDVKSDNILVTRPLDGATEPRVYLVDWELCQIGDPAWDVAGVLQDFILFWLYSMPQLSGTPQEMVSSAAYPLPVLQAAIRVFWQGYRRIAKLTAAESNALIARAVRFSAARLIQSAYEMAQNSQALPPHSVLLLQISANLLGDPVLGQVQLYGLFQEVGDWKPSTASTQI